MKKIFRQNILKHNYQDIYSSNDLVTMIHSIIQSSDDMSECCDIFEVEFDSDSIRFEPEGTEITTNLCGKSLISDLMFISVINSSRDLDIKLILGADNLTNRMKLCSDKVIVYSDDSYELSDVKNEVYILSSVDELLVNVGSEYLWSISNNPYLLSLAIYTRVLELHEISGTIKDEEFNIDSFVIGEHFLESLGNYQCSAGSRFGSACFDAISRLIFGAPKDDINPFRENSGSTSAQRTRNNDLAYRTHVTKGNEAIRLMLWKLPTGEYEFANVGNKFDLFIAH